MTVSARSFLRRRMVILATCALILAWFVISRSFAAYFAATAADEHAW